jgi:hypothetical protein
MMETRLIPSQELRCAAAATPLGDSTGIAADNARSGPRARRR